ncbi:MAG: prepilin-type N-terminal cleavage/methylation domain-containing protein [Gemmatimonadaceae bacterium]|nr:prepilin-type N-terminal cleavage/methylation domain-containing protein [Gemmatimonadaceae bacterium]
MMRRRRAGFSLVELIVATVVATLLGAGIIGVLSRQQKFYRAATEMLGVRAQLRDGAEVLAADIRGAAVATFGVPLMSDSAIELITLIGSSVLCSAPSGASVMLPPRTLASGNTLTSLLAVPDTGDIAIIYAAGTEPPDTATWETHRIATFAPASLTTSCPPSTGFTTDGDIGSDGYVVTLADTAVASVRAGAPIRFLRRVRYSLYRSSDAKWYLGYRRCNAIGVSSCGTVQPVSGPYMPYTGPGATETGISFRYYDQSGATLGAGLPGNTLARVDIVLKGQSASEVRLAGDARTLYRDSAIVTVSPRNRLR